MVYAIIKRLHMTRLVKDMKLEQIPGILAQELHIAPHQANAAISLLDDGNTVPFIARYRKEATGELDEEQIRSIEERLAYLRNLAKRQEEILASIEEQEKLTPELQSAIEKTTKLQELEDLYLPYRPKKRTRAQIAREKGLEPLADLLRQLPAGKSPDEAAAAMLAALPDIETVEDALAGASDIIAEQTSEDASIRAWLRKELWQKGEITAEFAVPEEAAKEVLAYKDYREPVKRMPSHRILAINRGEKKELLKVHLVAPHEEFIAALGRRLIPSPNGAAEWLASAIADGYKRLLFPALEREIRNLLTEHAEKQAIRVFSLNLRQLLLQAPLAGHTVIGLDPGYRTGCKVAVIDPTGAVLETTTIYITHSAAQKQQSAQKVLDLCRRHQVTLAAIGNGTASFETEEFVASLIAEHNLPLRYLIANEAGASVYSASKLAREEMPDLDVSIRGAVSIARRIQDPLAELVKIEPKAIGVGQYQHDVDQKELTHTLDAVVESAVNHVGVELNTASGALLRHVAGINATVAKNIVAHREANGPFRQRKELLKVARLGPAAYTQCAGFLRLASSSHPLDNTPVHPESYALTENLLAKLGFTFKDLSNKDRLAALQAQAPQADVAKLAQELEAGEPTVRDILAALAKPGRDPREDVPLPLTRQQVVKLSELQPGSIVQGTVHNVTDFGVFVDIGIKVKGLVHRSELSRKPFRHPLDVVSVGDILEVLILSVDEERNRIALSLKQVPAKE